MLAGLAKTDCLAQLLSASSAGRRTQVLKQHPRFCLASAGAARLVASMIDHMDEQDGDVALEPEHDCCEAGDDQIIAGHALHGFGSEEGVQIDTDDDEGDCREAWHPFLRRQRQARTVRLTRWLSDDDRRCSLADPKDAPLVGMRSAQGKSNGQMPELSLDAI